MFTVNALKKKTCFHFGSQDRTDEIMLPTGLPNYLIFFPFKISVWFSKMPMFTVYAFTCWCFESEDLTEKEMKYYQQGCQIISISTHQFFFFNLEPFYLKQHPWTINNPCAFEPPKSPTPHVQVGNSGSLRWKSKGELLGNTRKLIDGQWP